METPQPIQTADQAYTSAESEALQRERDQLQEERELWNRERQEQLHRLQSEGAMLKDAWQRLEHERRRLMADRELIRRGAAPAGAEGISQLAEPKEGSATAQVSAGSARTTQEESRLDWHQLQRMRREIQADRRAGPGSV